MTEPMSPRPGLYGRRPADPVNAARAARFSNLEPLTSSIAVPSSQDNLARIASRLKMLGNDQWGDCVAVMIANLIFLITGVYPTQDAVIEFYRTQNPNFPADDKGMDEQKALETLVSTGMRMPDGTYKKALFFAKVDHANSAEVVEAIALFGALGYGINVTSRNEQEFAAGQTWTWRSGDKDQGGHAVIGGGFTPITVRFGTWAAETAWDTTFDGHQVDEAWVVLFQEHIDGKVFLSGVDLATVAAEFKRVTGRTWPVAVPPAPSPPGPSPAGHVIYTMTVADAALVDGWQSGPHVWSKATKAAAALGRATRTEGA